jgi:hypothetical protein
VIVSLLHDCETSTLRVAGSCRPSFGIIDRHMDERVARLHDCETSTLRVVGTSNECRLAGIVLVDSPRSIPVLLLYTTATVRRPR